MKAKYFNYNQARAICLEYQNLKGQSFSDSTPVEAVLVAPYSRILQWHYVRHLLRGNSPESLLSQYPSGRYDVIVLFRDSSAPNGFAIGDLRGFLETHQLPFNARRYSCLKAA
jgi:hypothetical protein